MDIGRGLYIKIDAGETKKINKNNVLRIVNTKHRPMKVRVTNLTLFGSTGTKWINFTKIYQMDPPYFYPEYPENKVMVYDVACAKYKKKPKK